MSSNEILLTEIPTIARTIANNQGDIIQYWIDSKSRGCRYCAVDIDENNINHVQLDADKGKSFVCNKCARE